MKILKHKNLATAKTYISTLRVQIGGGGGEKGGGGDKDEEVKYVMEVCELDYLNKIVFLK